jgi:hypothetical protein
MSSQWAAVASQNFTCPGETGVVPAVTVAVSVTTVPMGTVVTAPPPLVIVSVVVVAVCASAGEPSPTRQPRAHRAAFRAVATKVRPTKVVLETKAKEPGKRFMKHLQTGPRSGWNWIESRSIHGEVLKKP